MRSQVIDEVSSGEASSKLSDLKDIDLSANIEIENIIISSPARVQETLDQKFESPP